MSQPNSQMQSTQIAVQRVQVSGVPTGLSAVEFNQALQGHLELALSSVGAPQGMPQSLHISRLRLQLPAGASEVEIAEALASAIADRVSRGSSP